MENVQHGTDFQNTILLPGPKHFKSFLRTPYHVALLWRYKYKVYSLGVLVQCRTQFDQGLNRSTRTPFRRRLARRALSMRILSQIEKRRPTMDTIQVSLAAVLQATIRCCVFRRERVTKTRKNFNLHAHLATIGDDLFTKLHRLSHLQFGDLCNNLRPELERT